MVGLGAQEISFWISGDCICIPFSDTIFSKGKTGPNPTFSGNAELATFYAGDLEDEELSFLSFGFLYTLIYFCNKLMTMLHCEFVTVFKLTRFFFFFFYLCSPLHLCTLAWMKL